MLKRWICAGISCLLLLATCSVLGAGAAEKNMFRNGDFERKLNNWQSWSNDPSNCTAEYAKGEGVRIINTTHLINIAKKRAFYITRQSL